MRFNHVQLENEAHDTERAANQHNIYAFLDESVRGFYEGVDSTIFA